MITEREILRLLQAGKVCLPPLDVRLMETEPKRRAAANARYQPEALVEVSWGPRRWRFLAELKANSTPREFENALAVVGPAASKARLNAMVILPYLSPGSLDRLEQSGISGLDLCGNGIVRVSEQVLVVRTGQPNRFPRSEPIRNVFRGDSSLVPRVFLAKPIYGAVGEIVTTIRDRGGSLTFATVSKVLKTLQEDLIVDRSTDKIRLLQADKLLDELAQNYRPPKILERYVGKAALSELELPKMLADAARRAGSRFAITGAASASRYAVFAREPGVAAYCTSSPLDLLRGLKAKFEETDRFPNVELLRLEEAPPFFELISEDGVNYASPTQAYLELISGDKRQRDAAAQVREFVLRRVREYRDGR